MESNHHPRVRSTVSYPLNEGGNYCFTFSNASLRIRNFLSWIVLLTNKYSMPSITCIALRSLQTTRCPLNLFWKVITFMSFSLFGRAWEDRTPTAGFEDQNDIHFTKARMYGALTWNWTTISVIPRQRTSHYTIRALLAPGVRIELTIAESKSVVLPLHYPGIKLVSLLGFEPRPHGPKPCTQPDNALERYIWFPEQESNL